MGFFKSIAAKVLGGVVAAIVLIIAITWWQMEPSQRQAAFSFIERSLVWLGVVIAFPWASFAIIARVARMGSNRAGGILVAVYSILEIVLLGWLCGWSISGAVAWTLFIFGSLLCAVYNVLACDWIAEKVA